MKRKNPQLESNDATYTEEPIAADVPNPLAPTISIASTPNKNRYEEELPRKLKNWQGSELTPNLNKQDQYLSWMNFKKIFNLNLVMLKITSEPEKLIALKLKGGPLVMAKLAPIDTQSLNFLEAWKFLSTEFEAPINKREELKEFINMSMGAKEDTFTYQTRVIKQAHLCGYTPEANEREIVDKMIYGHAQPMFFTAGHQSIANLTIASLKESAVMYEQTRQKTQKEEEPTLNIESTSDINSVTAPPYKFRNNNERRSENYRHHERYHPYGRYRDEIPEYGHKRSNIGTARGRRTNERLQSPCHFCGGKFHENGYCPAFGINCRYCSKPNHNEKACLKKKRDADQQQTTKTENGTVNEVKTISEDRR